MDTVYSIISGGLFIATAVVIVLSSYGLARFILDPGNEKDRTFDAAASIAVRLSAMHGLILALVYAQELDDYKGVRNALTEEAVAVADVYNDALRFGDPVTGPINTGLARYVSVVVNEEWRMLGEHQGLSSHAWQEWNAVYEKLLDLTPATDRQHYLASRMRERITAIARFRQLRAATAAGGYSTLFWVPALIGLLLVTVPFYVFRPTRSHLLLIALFGAYSGILLFFIYAFSNPFQEPGRLEPIAFQHLLQGEMSQRLKDDSGQ